MEWMPHGVGRWRRVSGSPCWGQPTGCNRRSPFSWSQRRLRRTWGGLEAVENHATLGVEACRDQNELISGRFRSLRRGEELLGELNGYLNVALCIPQLLVSLLGGLVISLAHSDTVLFALGAGFDLLAAALCWRHVT